MLDGLPGLMAFQGIALLAGEMGAQIVESRSLFHEYVQVGFLPHDSF